VSGSPFLRGSGLAKLLGDQPLPARAFTFGGADARFGAETRWCVRALSVQEQLASVGAAIRFLCETCGFDRQDLFTDIGSAALDLESKVQALAVGLVDPADARKAFAKDAAEVRRIFEADEVERLFNELSDFTLQRSPLSRAADNAEVQALIVAVGKGLAPKTKLLAFDFATLVSITHSLACQLYAPTRDSSSPSRPSSDPSATPAPTE
jgi:hypothetical protein